MSTGRCSAFDGRCRLYGVFTDSLRVAYAPLRRRSAWKRHRRRRRISGGRDVLDEFDLCRDALMKAGACAGNANQEPLDTRCLHSDFTSSVRIDGCELRPGAYLTVVTAVSAVETGSGATKRYPNQGSVTMYRGFAGSGSSFLRSCLTNTRKYSTSSP